MKSVVVTGLSLLALVLFVRPDIGRQMQPEIPNGQPKDSIAAAVEPATAIRSQNGISGLVESAPRLGILPRLFVPNGLPSGEPVE